MPKEIKYTKYIETDLKQKQKVHKKDAFKAHQFHHTVIERCRRRLLSLSRYLPYIVKLTLISCRHWNISLHFQLTTSKWSFFHIGDVQPSQIKHSIFTHDTLELSIAPLTKIQSICLIKPYVRLTIPFYSWRVTFKLFVWPTHRSTDSLYFPRQCL